MSASAAALENELTFTRFDQMSERYPDKTAVIYLGQHFSFSKLRDLSERFSGALVDLAVKKGDRVMIYIPNCVQWVVAFLGIQKIGAVIVPVSPIYTSYELDYMIKDSGAETIICQDTNSVTPKKCLPIPGSNESLLQIWLIFCLFGSDISASFLIKYPPARWSGSRGCLHLKNF